MKVLVGLIVFGSGWASACANSAFNAHLPWQEGPTDVYVETLQRRIAADPSGLMPEFKAWYREQMGIPPGSPAEPREDEYLALRDMLTGNPDAAVERLLSMEAAAPGDYSTAANLGTAYELAGNNAMAHFWIAKGIERNPESHYGTEWLHLRILEAKIAMEDDPDYLKNRHIVPVPEDGNFFGGYRIETGGVPKGWGGAKLALRYQLGERMLFVKPQDPVVADLLYSAARLHASLRDWREAAILLELAREYGYHDTADLEAWLATYKKTHWNERKKKWSTGLLATAITLFLGYRFFWCLGRFAALAEKLRDLEKEEMRIGKNL